jgi:hypothetical protein
MKISRILTFVLVIMLGIFMFVYGGYDDSPGGQGIGVVAVIIGIVGLIRKQKKSLK